MGSLTLICGTVVECYAGVMSTQYRPWPFATSAFGAVITVFDEFVLQFVDLDGDIKDIKE